jgi:cytochrome c biogenesis protein CcmG, thiol:disulfide interchange protein DsbE
MRKMIGISLLALLCQTLLVSPGWSLEVGAAIPEFALKSLAGDTVTRESLAGKPALLVFWNTWCPICREELPLINRLAGKYATKGVTVLAINTGLNDSESKTRAYWKKSGYQFPTGFDGSFAIGEAFGVRGVPTVLLVDAKGVVRYQSPLFPENMDERIRQLAGR